MAATYDCRTLPEANRRTCRNHQAKDCIGCLVITRLLQPFTPERVKPVTHWPDCSDRPATDFRQTQTHTGQQLQECTEGVTVHPVMNAGAAGFAGCPVSKFVLAASVSSSIAAQAAQGFKRRPPSYLRFLAQTLVFRHPGELACGALLLYYFRLFERRRGSAKQGAFVASTLALNYAVQKAASAALSATFPSGPYGLIFASFVPFTADVPPAQRFTLFGLPLTDKVSCC